VGGRASGRDEGVDVVVYAHSIDFGAKGYGNLVQLAAIQHEVAQRLARPVGKLTFVITSGHIYDTELTYMRGVLAAV
jgi:thymidylate synthase